MFQIDTNIHGGSYGRETENRQKDFVRGSHDASVTSGACRSRIRAHVRGSRTLNYSRSGERSGSFFPVRLRPVK